MCISILGVQIVSSHLSRVQCRRSRGGTTATNKRRFERLSPRKRTAALRLLPHRHSHRQPEMFRSRRLSCLHQKSTRPRPVFRERLRGRQRLPRRHLSRTHDHLLCLVFAAWNLLCCRVGGANADAAALLWSRGTAVNLQVMKSDAHATSKRIGERQGKQTPEE